MGKMREEILKIAKPILFNTEMVQAIQYGRKTVTRRVCHIRTISRSTDVNHNDCYIAGYPERNIDGLCANFYSEEHYYQGCAKPPCKVGDILYVRETWFYEEHMHDITAGEPDLPSGRYSFRYVYKAEYPDYPVNVGVGADGWRPSIHMPKEAARIFLRVADVRVERLQNIDDDGVVSEGLEIGGAFDELWDSTIKKSALDKYGWNANPWVWVIEFERMEMT